MPDLNIFDLLRGMLTSFAEFAPNIIGALIFILVGYIIARFVRKGLKKLFTRIGVDKLSNYINDMELFGESSFKLSLSAILTSVIYYMIMLMVWVAASDILGIEAISQLLNDVIAYVPNLLVAFIYLLIGVLVADLARKFVQTTFESLGIPSATLIAGFVFYFLIINILLGALTQAKINTEFIASNISIILGGVVLAFAIGYGFASRDIAGNIINAFYWKDKFEVGDEIEVEGVVGRVVEVERSNLILDTAEGTAIVPMNKISKNTVVIRKKA